MKWYDYPGRFKSAHGQNFARWQMDGWAKQRRNRAGNEPLAGDMAGTANCADGASAGEPEPGMAGGGK
ncbi:Rhs element Vgr protein [Escherichia coli]|uniref:Rhs element Vgr protein n=1 Tax=Escherichia coli TaxID=562 RepID=A0A2X1IN05_ECOLX|nr:Rhs element Vgr protein [Escherichia coli]